MHIFSQSTLKISLASIILLSVLLIDIVYPLTTNVYESFGVGGPPKRAIFLGDSILNNSLFVPPNHSVESKLRHKLKNIEPAAMLTSYAKNGAMLSDFTHQISQIQTQADSTQTVVIVSFGGNNLLSAPSSQASNTVPLLDEHANCLNQLLIYMPTSKIIILDVYFPVDAPHNLMGERILRWNSGLADRYKDVDRVSILNISGALTTSKDFVGGIEPSVYGSEKIADRIFKSMYDF